MARPIARRHIAIYVRCSSNSQDTKAQRAQLEAWAEHQAERVRWYVDEAYSGTTTDRPAWRQLEQDLRAGRVARVVCQALDRCSRSVRDFLAFIDECEKLGVGFYSLREGLDPFTTVGRFVMTCLAGFAEMENKIRLERQLTGIAHAKSNGKRWGGRKQGVRNHRTAKVAARVRRLHKEGQAVASIAKLCGVSRPTVYAILAG